MRIEVDNGQKFDFGKTSEYYAKYRDIYPKELFDKLYELGVGIKGSDWLDLGTGTGVIPRGLAKYGANISAVDIAEEQIEEAKVLSEGLENIRYYVASAEDIEFENNSFDVITACQCFWYFDPDIIVPKIKKMLRDEGMFLKIYMSHMKEDEIASGSFNLVKEMRQKYTGASPSIQDLTTHYFENPHMETFIVDIPFTREAWHGRVMASRGVMASMDEETTKNFAKKHLDYLDKYPEEFVIRHKVFLTYYYMDKK